MLKDVCVNETAVNEANICNGHQLNARVRRDCFDKATNATPRMSLSHNLFALGNEGIELVVVLQGKSVCFVHETY